MSGPASNAQWYLARDGQQFGPISDAEMAKFVELGHLKATDLLWREGFPDWRPAMMVFPPRARSMPGPMSGPASGHVSGHMSGHGPGGPRRSHEDARQPAADRRRPMAEPLAAPGPGDRAGYAGGDYMGYG